MKRILPFMHQRYMTKLFYEIECSSLTLCIYTRGERMLNMFQNEPEG